MINEELREKQIQFLDSCESKESLGRESQYVIYDYKTRKCLDSCQSAGTAQMLLETKYQNQDVWIKKG